MSRNTGSQELQACHAQCHAFLQPAPVVAKAAAGGAGLIIAQLQLRQHELVLTRDRDREVPNVIVVRVLVHPRLAGGEAVDVQVSREPLLRVWACTQQRAAMCGQLTGFRHSACRLCSNSNADSAMRAASQLLTLPRACAGPPRGAGQKPTHLAASGAMRACPAPTTAASESGSWLAGGCAAAHHPRCTTRHQFSGGSSRHCPCWRSCNNFCFPLHSRTARQTCVSVHLHGEYAPHWFCQQHDGIAGVAVGHWRWCG
jgi:hypothetical protein